MSAEDGIVHLWDLPENDVCIRLLNNIQKQMVEKALKIINSRYELAHIIGVKAVNIYDFEKYRFNSITLSFVKKLSIFLVANGLNEFSLKNLESKIELVKSKFVGNIIFHPKFPINFNCKEGSEIVSGILFDGGLSAEGYPFYTNNEKFLIDKIIECVEKVIGKLEYYTRNVHPNTIMVGFPKVVGYMLYNIGVPRGKKVFSNPSIPEFIINNFNLYRPFLQQAFDDEGSVHPGKSGKSIQLTQYHTKRKLPLRLLRLKDMIEKCGIIVNNPYFYKEFRTKQDYITYGWMIEISNQANIRKFSELIGFSLPRKQEKLIQLLNSYKLPPRFRDGTRLEEVLKVCEELKAQNQKITNKSIADKLKRDSAYMSELTTKLVGQGKLTIVKEKSPLEGSSRGFTSKEFEVMR